MSRVTHSTFRAALASGLVLAALGVSACGDNDTAAGDASSQATPAATTAEATTPTTPKTTTPKTQNVTLPKVIHSKIAVTPEGLNAINHASKAKISPEALQKQANEIVSKLKHSGFPDAKANVVTAVPNSPIVINSGKTASILVYPTEDRAARQAAGFILVLQRAKTDGRIARYGNVLVGLSSRKGIDSKLKAEFAKARAAAAQI